MSKSLPRKKHDHPLVDFRKSQIHGWGGYAKAKIRKGKRIIEYIGPRLNKEQAERELLNQNCYVFTVTDDSDIDGSVRWNPARFLNHSCDPNCESDIKRDRVWIYALRTIQPGEELTYNYAHELDDYADRPCRCGSEKCVGFMVAEEHFKKVQRATAKAARR